MKKMSTRFLLRTAAAGLCIGLFATSPAAFTDPEGSGESAKEKVLRMPIRTAGPGSLDPVLGSTVYDNQCSVMVYETLVQYKYLKRPLELEPLLLEEMPKISDDGLTYSFKLKKGVMFQDDPCFAGGKGRELVSKDVFYSWKRMADLSLTPKSWWIYKDTIKGFDEYRDAQNEAAKNGGKFDYDAPVEGFKIINDHEFQVILKRPVYRFMWILAMFQTSVVAREAVEEYGTRLGRHPVGTGPYVMKEGDWIEGKSIVFTKNPNYRKDFYPKEFMPEDEAFGFHDDVGKEIPFIDRVEITFFIQEQPMWLEFKGGNLDFTQVPAEYFLEAFHKRSKKLKKDYKEKGIVSHNVPLLDFIFRGINMEDEVLGGYSDEKKALRQAISLAIDLEEFNDVFYNSVNIVYDGMIPPGLDGYPEDGQGPVTYMGPDLDKAKSLLAKAGYPGGKGLPPIDYYVSRSGNSPEQAELMKRQLKKIGVELNVRLVTFPELIAAVNKKKAAFFSFAWSSDYPDGENNLALFFGPNESPGSNHFNYKNAKYDELYNKIQTMPPSPERTKIYETMRDMVVEDVPYIGSMARTRFYLINPWLKNFKPTEDFYNWVKYLDIDGTVKRP